MKKIIPASELPELKEPATTEAKAEARALETTAFVSGSTCWPRCPIPLNTTSNSIAIITPPTTPSCEATAIGQLDARELPKPAPRPLVSMRACRLLMFQ